MATVVHIQPQENTNLGQGYMVVQWQGLTTTNNVGDYFTCAGWVIASVDWQGTPGATPTFTLQGSNQLQTTPTVPSTISAFTATAVGLVTPASFPAVARIRPTFTGGDGTTNMTCMVLLVR